MRSLTYFRYYIAWHICGIAFSRFALVLNVLVRAFGAKRLKAQSISVGHWSLFDAPYMVCI